MSAPPPEASPEELLGTLGAKEGRVRALVRRSDDWPRKGVTFLDITPLLCDGAALAACVDALAQRYKKSVTHVAGIDARGFPLGCAVAYALGVGFIMVRKAGKLPPRDASGAGRLLAAEYELEYGAAKLELGSDVLDSAGVDTNVLVVDDLVATGGSAIAACNLLRDAGAVVHEVAVIVELAGNLQPRQRIKAEACVRLHSLLVFDA